MLMSDCYRIVPRIQITSRQAVLYGSFEMFPNRSKKQIDAEIHLTRGKYNGYMSPKTKSKVSKYLSTWLESIDVLRKSYDHRYLKNKPYITFVTLTLSHTQIHSDIDIKRKLLMPFIQKLKRNYDVKNYYWRAEAQQCGNIHFHLLVDRYIDWKELRDDWNDTQDVLGYIDRFEMKHNHRIPNSTDIHALYEKRSIASYVLKYVTKADGYRPIKGRIHGCSDNLKEMKPFDIVMTEDVRQLVAVLFKDKALRIYQEKAFTVFKGDILGVMYKRCSRFYVDYNKNLLDIAIRNYGDQTLHSKRSCDGSRDEMLIDKIMMQPQNQQTSLFNNEYSQIKKEHVERLDKYYQQATKNNLIYDSY